MRNARLSVETIMVRVSTSQQPPAKHVSHAEIGGLWKLDQEGQRWALLTTKSRKTWTRATVFNSSG